MTAQRGFALFELLLSAAVALLIAIWASQALVHRIQDAGAQNIARWMLTIRHGVKAYLEHNRYELRWAQTSSDLASQGFQNWAEPTMLELKQAGFLGAGFPELMRVIQGVEVKVLREGECPGDHCRIEAVIYGQRAFLTKTGAADEQMLAQWQLAAEGLGGIVHPLQPGVVRGHTFQYANPLQGGFKLPAGTVAMAISNEQLTESDYLIVKDKRNPQFQSDVSVVGRLASDTVVSAGQYLHLGRTEQWMNDCSLEGAITRDPERGLLVCAHGYWQSASRSSGGYSVNSKFGCATPEGRPTANPVTHACSCPSGHNAVLISEGSADNVLRGITRGYLCVQ